MPERSMRFRPLGDSGLMVSVVGLGCNAFGERVDVAVSETVIGAALDAGITFFDTADTYGHGASEEILGRMIRKRRDEVIVASKFGMDAHGANGPDWGARASRRYIRRAVEGSLRRLGTGYIDLYQMHWPDRVTPKAETLSAMNELITEGKVRYLGCSHLSGWEVVDWSWQARSMGLQGFISAQNEYSLYNRHAEVEVVPACRAHGLGVLPYFPLASGLLTGKYQRSSVAPAGSNLAAEHTAPRLAAADWDLIADLELFAQESGATLLDVGLGGLAAQPGVGSVIAGATTADQVAMNVQAGLWEPSADGLCQLDAIEQTHGARSLSRYFTPGRF